MNMDSRFSHLRQRDTSVSMLRVKMSRRRSQSQKENRERAVNKRRQLDKLPEMDISSLDASMAVANMSIIQEKTINNAKSAKNQAAEERQKQLERWRERKALEKEKEMREKARKGVFKTGLFHAKDSNTLVPLPQVPAASTRAKETKVITAPSQSTRVTRSMKTQQQVQKPLKTQNSNTAAKKAPPAAERSTRSRATIVKPAPQPSVTKTKVCAVEPVVRAASTRSVNKPPVTAVPAVKDKPKDMSADVRTTRSRAVANVAAPPSGRGRNCKATVNIVHPVEPEEPEMQETEEKPGLAPCSEEVDMVVDQAPADTVEEPSSLSSFAPTGFVFKAPAGLFKFEPLTPRSANAFLTPSCSVSLPPVPVFNFEAQAEPSKPSPPKSPRRSPPRPSPTAAPPTPGSPLESKHDVPYFRSEIASETDRLTSLCTQWECKVEDESIPEEMRDRMRTAVGQARLLMKERFNQFSGLVDDCELGRGEKITTCTDLQGFWDMVYYQVEDVNKKFDALKEAEARGWVEEHKPQPRRKVVKKPAAAPAPAKPAGTKAAAKSRLAAVKAAMKAKQQAAEAEKAAMAAAAAATPDPSLQETQPQAEAQKKTDTVLFDGGFFQVESPSRPAGPVRRSSRLSAAVLPQASPSTSYLSPRRVTRRSLALAQTPVQTLASPARPVHTPAHFCLTLDQTPAQAPKSQHSTPQLKDAANASLCFSPVKEVSSDNTQPEGDPAPSTQDSTSPVPESDTAIPMCPLPSFSADLEQDKPSEAVNADIPRLTLSPCKSPPAVSETPEPPVALSFTLSPCLSPQSSPTAMSSPPAADTQESMCHTPENEVLKETPGFDFERYLQSSQRCSLSPRESVAIETLSPMAVDVEMESPRGQNEDLLTQEEAALPAVSSVLTPQSPQTQTKEMDLFLFTPDLKDRIRQSVCPNDLMVFTPPS